MTEVRTPLRVLEISARSDLGGGPKHLKDLLQSWKSLKTIEVFVAAPNEGENAREFSTSSFQTIPIPHRKFSLGALFYLRSYVLKHDIPVIHSHGKGAGIYSRALSFLTGIPVLHTFHGLHVPVTIKEKIYRPIELFLSHWTHTYICVSKAERDVATQVYGLSEKKCRIIPNGIQSDLLSRGQPRYRTSTSTKTFGILARMEEFPKNIGRAIHSFAQAENSFDLILAGDGPDLESYRRLVCELGIESRVRFLGAIRGVEDFFASIDVYVSLSSKEGLPYSLLEAKAAGKACLLSDITPHREAAPAATEWFDGTPEAWSRAATRVGRIEPTVGISEMAERTFTLLSEVAKS